jgi:hypothetical protein
MKKLGALMVAVGCVTLLGSPALAQSSSGGTMGNMSSPNMKSMKAKPPAKKGGAKMTAKLSCMDYAWESQDQKDCTAGKKAPPTGR